MYMYIMNTVCVQYVRMYTYVYIEHSNIVHYSNNVVWD